MARKKTYGKEIAKLFLGVVLLILAVIGLSYGSLLKGMDQAAADYARGDNEAALKKYETIEARVRGLGAIRIIPAKDRRNLILNEARLLYALGKYDEAMERMEAENTISGNTTDGRFLLLRGEIAFRKAVKNYRESAKKDPRVLEEQLRGAEDNLRDSLRMAPDDWDAKYNFEFVNYIRNLMNADEQGKIKILMENVRIKEMQPKALPADQQG
jgi:tetratricopeptide (TPR) repeat protein